MKCCNALHNRPYIPLNRPEDQLKPYICRLAPNAHGFEGEWLDNHFDGPHTLYWGKRDSGEHMTQPLTSSTFTVTGLEEDVDYELFVLAANGQKSNVRLLHTGDAPNGATVINYLHPEDEQYIFSGKYLCSPSLVRLDNGHLIAGMDIFATAMAQNLTILFTSEDDGKTWRYLTDLYPMYWGHLFVHKGVLYMLGMTTEYGNLQIACSLDNGHTWSAPVPLVYGSNVLCENGGFHRAPMQMVSYKGKLYTSAEYGSWKSGSHLPTVLCVDEDADLMKAENWSYCGFAPFEGAWKEAAEGVQKDTMEGNIVLGPDGKMYNILRWALKKALIMTFDPDDFDTPPQFVELREMPVSNAMFRILPYKGKYVMVANRKGEHAIEQEGGSYRNVLSVHISEDLKNWQFITDVVNFEHIYARKIGFQYPCVLLEGDTLYMNVRSGYNGARGYHDTNTMLFWKVEL